MGVGSNAELVEASSRLRQVILIASAIALSALPFNNPAILCGSVE